jgi:hypothetical protein
MKPAPHWTTLLLASSIPLGAIGIILLFKYGWALTLHLH